MRVLLTYFHDAAKQDSQNVIKITRCPPVGLFSHFNMRTAFSALRYISSHSVALATYSRRDTAFNTNSRLRSFTAVVRLVPGLKSFWTCRKTVLSACIISLPAGRPEKRIQSDLDLHAIKWSGLGSTATNIESNLCSPA